MNGLKKYGYIISLTGEALIVIQSIIFFSQLFLYRFLLEMINFEGAVFLPLISIPIFLITEFLILIVERKAIKYFDIICYIALLCLTSITLYLGGGWYIGIFFVIIGVLFRIAAKTWQKKVKFKKKYAIFLLIILVIMPFTSLLIQSSVKVRTARKIPVEIMAGPPRYDNILYMTPILEYFTGDSVQDNAEIEFLKATIGPSGDYYKIGFSVSCWYSANLINNSGIWDFDPTWLYYKLNRSVDTNTPLLLHMNGGNWGSCGMSNDLLKDLWANASNCQYDQFDRVPEIQNDSTCLKDRLFSLQKDTDFNKYREIHVKQAGAILSNFSQNYPDLFVGCSLDSEIHLDFTLGGELYYDYNPIVIGEYQNWLASRYSLAEYNSKFDKSESSFGTIDAPRNPVFGDPLWEEWTTFRHHLVQQNVELQAKWLNESGIPKNKIYSHQILTNSGDKGANYGRCDTLETTATEYGVVGVTRYNYINPDRFWDIYDLNGTNWGIFEWNIWHDRVQSDYHLYLIQLKAMYQAGVHVICPNGWFEFVNPRLMIRNNTIFHRALVDFAYLVKDVPRGTAPDGFLNFFDYLYVYFMNFNEFQLDFLSITDFLDFLFSKLWSISIISTISVISVITIVLYNKYQVKKRLKPNTAD